MRTRITVIPKADRVVRDPMHGRIVPERGAEVVASAYWRRLELDGDVEIKEPGILPPLRPDLDDDAADDAADE